MTEYKGFKIGDSVNFKTDSGTWNDKVFKITGFITEKELETELNSTYSVGILGENRREERKCYEHEEDIRTVYLDWNCHWFPIQAKRLRLATLSKSRAGRFSGRSVTNLNGSVDERSKSSPFQGEGRGFKSRQSHHVAG